MTFIPSVLLLTVCILFSSVAVEEDCGRASLDPLRSCRPFIHCNALHEIDPVCPENRPYCDGHRCMIPCQKNEDCPTRKGVKAWCRKYRKTGFCVTRLYSNCIYC